MKKLRILMLAMLLPAFVMTGCDKGGDDNGDAQIVLPNDNEKTQQAFADDETTGGFTFTAKQAWTATVTETGATRVNLSGGSATSDSGVDWLRLLFDGEETYSGAAGTFNLVIELDENYSGKTRTATITIKSGNDTITITVTQDGKTETGVVPTPPEPAKKLISKIVAKNGGETIYAEEFGYDIQGRVVRVTYSDGDIVRSTDEVTWASDRITKSDGEQSEWAVLGSGNLATEYWNNYGVDGAEQGADILYENGAMSKITDYDKGAVEMVSLLSWDADGNNIEMDILDSEGALDWEVAITYTSYPNNLNFDLNWLVTEMYVGELNQDFIAETGVFGKRSANLIESYGEYWEDGSFYIEYSYEFDQDGYVTRVIEDFSPEDEDNTEDDRVFEIYYY